MATFQAILFDCDGTLADTEVQTGQAITQILAEAGIPDASLAPYWTSGRKWSEIVGTLHQQFPESRQIEGLKARLTERWELLVQEAPLLPGVKWALEQARRYCSLALVTSSPSRSVGPLFATHGIDALLPPSQWVCAEHVQRSKPHPEGFLLAAKKLGVSPRHCLVFEDSIAGIQAARAAGMSCVAVLETTSEPARCHELAGYSIRHFGVLPYLFWRSLSRGVPLGRLLPPPAGLHGLPTQTPLALS